MIVVRYFASLRERQGRDCEQLSPDSVATVADVLERVGGADWPSNTLMAVNHEYVQLDQSVRDGDEVAFFPPVTGG